MIFDLEGCIGLFRDKPMEYHDMFVFFISMDKVVRITAHRKYFFMMSIQSDVPYDFDNGLIKWDIPLEATCMIGWYRTKRLGRRPKISFDLSSGVIRAMR